MDGLYCEARTKKMKSFKDTLIKAGIVIGIVAGFALSFCFGGICLLISVAFGILAYVVFPRLNVEYEYVFVDGQIDFDKIMNGEKRKRMARIDFDQVVVCAPQFSHALDGYRRDGIPTYNYSSLPSVSNNQSDAKPVTKEDGSSVKVWGIVTTAGEKNAVYYFEPDENMVQKMKQKSPRKIVEY